MVHNGVNPIIMLLPWLWLACALAVLIIVLSVLWRGMKAHESIAESLRQIAHQATSFYNPIHRRTDC